jgi:hypothetical protein
MQHENKEKYAQKRRRRENSIFRHNQKNGEHWIVPIQVWDINIGDNVGKERTEIHSLPQYW